MFCAVTAKISIATVKFLALESRKVMIKVQTAQPREPIVWKSFLLQETVILVLRRRSARYPHKRPDRNFPTNGNDESIAFSDML
uniref:Uncharacterized protein n=1 Tax=Arion vulgaris TaxID=1028688 RepID=A0A0B7AHR2_9EUPU